MVDTKSHISYIPDLDMRKDLDTQNCPLQIFEIAEILYRSYRIISIFGSKNIWSKLILKDAPICSQNSQT